MTENLPTPAPGNSGEFLLFQTEDGRTRIQCRFENESIWLTQALIAELFQVTPQNVTLHLKAIYEEGELHEGATCKEYLQVRSEGNRSRRNSKHRKKETSAPVCCKQQRKGCRGVQEKYIVTKAGRQQ